MMKARVEGKKLFFWEYTEKELEKVQKLLSWSGNEYVDPETLLLRTDEGQPYTFWGLHSIIAQQVNLEVSGLSSDISYAPYKVPDDYLPGISLYDFQHAAIQKGLKFKTGIIEIPTGGGKTECILAILKALFDQGKIHKAVIVVPSIGLVKQFYRRSLLRGFPLGMVGRVHGGLRELDCPITVGVVNSLNQGYHESAKVKELIEEADVVIEDECQHSKARTHMELILGAKNASYSLFFSGTPFRSEDILDDAGDSLTYGLSGGTIFSIPLQYLVSRGIVAEPIVYFKSLPGIMSKFPGKYHRIYRSGVAEGAVRNQSIADFERKFREIGFPTLILTKLKDHSQEILRRTENPRAIYISGGANATLFSGEEFTVDYDVFAEEFEMGNYDTLIATPVFDEGMDLPSVQAFINAAGERSYIKQCQRLGRAIRKKFDGINRVYIVDFVDRSHVWLYAQYKKRLKIYENLGLRITYDELYFNRMLHDHIEARKTT